MSKIVCLQSEDELPSGETLQWADGLLLVYSITDRNSFNFVRKAKEALAVIDPEASIPLALVGNKADMIHLRQVSTEEGEILAKDFECWFGEVSAAEQVFYLFFFKSTNNQILLFHIFFSILYVYASNFHKFLFYKIQ